MNLLIQICVLLLTIMSSFADRRATGPEPQRIHHLMIYSNNLFYSSFPSVVQRPGGELIVAFRRAPERRAFGETRNSHTDPNSQLVLTRSKDKGETWSEPTLLFAHPFGGSQDPCLLQLKNGSLLCSSYGWALLNSEAAALRKPALSHGNFVFLGGWVLASSDAGENWAGPFLPPSLSAEQSLDAFGNAAPGYNRGAMCQLKDGSILWAVAANRLVPNRLSSTHLLVSKDLGRSWNYACPIASDEKVTFNETSLYETPKGEIVAFMRTANHDDQTVIARSTNRGRSFGPWQDAGFQGHPHHAIRLPDKRVLLVYGYRHEPFGIRARVLDSECDNISASKEIVLRSDGGSGDLGYPWATMVGKDRVLVVYYFNKKDGTRHIAGTMLPLK